MRRHLLARLLSAASTEAVALNEARVCSGACRGLAVLARARVPTAGDQVFQPTCLRHALDRPPNSVLASLQQGAQRRGMFIQTQTTPNPTSLMFLPGRPVLEGSSRNFASAREAMASALAKRLFLIDGVTQVFFGSNFVTVTKSDDYSWAVLKPDVFAAITEFYATGEPLLYEESPEGTSAGHLISEEDDEVVAMIKELLETRIRPAVQEDGGDIAFRAFDADSGVVTLKMMGACSGCPSSALTLKGGIENMLMHYIPEVTGVVEAEADEYENEGTKAFNKLEQHLSA